MAIIAVFNQKGGVGKTTTALNLLAAVAQRKARPLGIDLDPQGHLSHIFGVQPRLADDSVYGFFMRQRPLEEIAQVTRSGVVLCPSHLELAKLDTLLGKGVNVVTRLRQALHSRRAMPGPVDHRLLPAAQRAVAQRGVRRRHRAGPRLGGFPVAAGRRAGRARAECARAGVQAAAAAPVRADALRRAAEDECGGGRRGWRSRCAPTRSASTRIRENVKLAESPAVGLDIFRHAPDSRGARDYAALYDELVGAGLME